MIQQAALSVTAVAATGIRRRQIIRNENDPDLSKKNNISSSSSSSSLTLKLLSTIVLEDLDKYHLRRTPIALVVRPILFQKESLVTSSQVHITVRSMLNMYHLVRPILFRKESLVTSSQVHIPVRSMLLPKRLAIVNTIQTVKCGENQQVSWMLVLTTNSN